MCVPKSLQEISVLNLAFVSKGEPTVLRAAATITTRTERVMKITSSEHRSIEPQLVVIFVSVTGRIGMTTEVIVPTRLRMTLTNRTHNLIVTDGMKGVVRTRLITEGQDHGHRHHPAPLLVDEEVAIGGSHLSHEDHLHQVVPARQARTSQMKDHIGLSQVLERRIGIASV